MNSTDIDAPSPLHFEKHKPIVLITPYNIKVPVIPIC